MSSVGRFAGAGEQPVSSHSYSPEFIRVTHGFP